MNTLISPDGTTIAFERSGKGEIVILVGASLQDRSTYRSLAESLAARFTVLNYDRRGRGDSGDTLPYAVEREIEDLGALMAEAGGKAAVYGHSSGAALALRAAASGLTIKKLVLHEPPYTPEDEAQKRNSRTDAEAIRKLLEEGKRSEAVAYILTGVGLPPDAAGEMSRDPKTVAMAHTLAYDSEVMDDLGRGGGVPTELLGAVTPPTLVLCGGASPAWMVAIGEQVANSLPDGRLRVLEKQGHFAPPEVLGPVLSEFLTY